MADAAGDGGYVTPGIGRRAAGGAGDGLGYYVALAGFCGFWGSRGAVGEIWGYSTLDLVWYRSI